MKKNLHKLLAVVLASTMVASMSGCGKSGKTVSNDATPTKSSEATPTEKPRDLGGMDVTLANWWEPATPVEPANQKEEDTLKYRNEMQKKYNFKFKVTNIGSWGEYQEIVVSSIMSGNPAANVFVMDQSFVGAPLGQGLLYPLNTIKSFNGFKDVKWNQKVKDLMTFDGNTYGMATGRMEPRLGIFWNKRLFEEAGLDPELPYDLQKSGEWTWDKFTEIAKKLTRDTNNDGTPDVYALQSFSVDWFRGCVTSNGAHFITKDSTGKFVNATGDANFLEALKWGRSFMDQKLTMPQPKGSSWDWFIQAFKEGKVAMQCAEEYKVGTWKDMDDDWGFVIFPKGPKGEMMTVFGENIVVMPAGVDADKTDKAAFAYDLWTNETPGYKDADTWKENYYKNFRDSRAVDETLPLFYEEKHGTLDPLPLVPGLSYGDITYSLDAGQSTPQECVEKVSTLWKTFIDKANNSKKTK